MSDLVPKVASYAVTLTEYFIIFHQICEMQWLQFKSLHKYFFWIDLQHPHNSVCIKTFKLSYQRR